MARSNVRRASLALRRHPAPNFISIHVIRLFVAATVGVILLSLGPCSGSRDPGILGASAAQVPLQAPPKPRKLAFRLSSIIHRGSDRTFAEAELAESLAALSVPVSASSRLDYVRYGPENIHAAQDGRDMLVPDHTDPQTVLALAYMAYNAYSLPPSDSFHSVPGWNLSTGFGWAEDGIRGYVFTTFEEERGHTEAEGEVIAVSIKGTSPGAFGVGGPTSGKDKYNDNLMFSCCCGRLPGSFRAIPGCDCFKSSYTCSAACLTEVCGSWQDSYYRMAQEIVGHLMHLHPKANIWLVGHSLGGALAGTTATAYGIPAFAFEAPGDALFASRLGLVPRFSDPDYIPRMRASHVFHWGNTGDPIFLGVCNGISSSCYMSGYALESKCHIGRTCTFDLDRIGDPVEPPPDAPGDGDGSGGPSEPGSPDPADPSPPDCGKRWWWPYPKPNCTDTPEPTPEPAPTPEPEPEPEEPCKEWWWWPWPSCNDTVPATTGTAKMAVATPAPDSRTTQKASKPKPTMEDYRRRALARLRRQELSPRPADVDTNAFVSIQKHRMNYLIYDVMLKWSGPLPECVVEEGCEECTGWSFVK